MKDGVDRSEGIGELKGLVLPKMSGDWMVMFVEENA